MHLFKIYYFAVVWKNVVNMSDVICIVWDKRTECNTKKGIGIKIGGKPMCSKVT